MSLNSEPGLQRRTLVLVSLPSRSENFESCFGLYHVGRKYKDRLNSDNQDRPLLTFRPKLVPQHENTRGRSLIDPQTADFSLICYVHTVVVVVLESTSGAAVSLRPATQPNQR